jgi:hypothetical protein
MFDKTLVPDKLHGYMLQVRHMLYELISVDNRIVSIEAFDDVAVDVDGVITAEQIKSVTSNNNPLSERSPAFWKTLYNWSSYIENGSLPTDAILRLVVVSNKNINVGAIQTAFSNAISYDDAKSALLTAKNKILVTEDLSGSYKDYINSAKNILWIFIAIMDSIIELRVVTSNLVRIRPNP